MCAARLPLALAAVSLAAAAALTAAAPLAVSVLDVAGSLASDGFRMNAVDMDFWPATKNKWGPAASPGSALLVDLDNRDLLTLAAGLEGALLRLGGSPADFLLYESPDVPDACSAANLNKTNAPVGSYFCPIWHQVVGECLSSARWSAILAFARRSGLRVVFDLNACWGRNSSTSDMDWTQIDGFLAATARSPDAASVFAFEFANEVYDNIAAPLYGAAIARLRDKIDELWAEVSPALRPLMVGPDCWEADLSVAYYTEMLRAANGSLHAVTVHDYGDDCCVCTGGNVLNLTCLDLLPSGAAGVVAIAAPFNVRVWNGEMALHASSGIDGLTDTFVSSLFYVNALASYAAAGIGLVARQTLVGGSYELVNRSTFQPTPDYFALLLWRAQVAGQMIGVSTSRPSASVRVYAFCAHGSAPGSGAAVVIAVNFATDADASLSLDWPAAAGASSVSVWQLTGVEGREGEGTGAAGPANWPSNALFRAALNGATLAFASGGALPPLTAEQQPAAAALRLPALSITFVRRDDAGASASC